MKALLCSLDGHGFVYPFIGIAESLRRRGHEVAMVTGPAFGPLLASLGIRRWPCGAQDHPSFVVKQWHDSRAVALQVMHIEYALREFDADLLVGQQLTLGPLLVRERRRLPVALLGFAAYLWPRATAAAAGDEDATGDEALRSWRLREMVGTYNRARALARLPPIPYSEGVDVLLGDLNLLRSVRELEDESTLPPRVQLVGDCLWEPAACDPELERWLAEAEGAGLPLLYVQHGKHFTDPSFWPALVAALAAEPCYVAASVGNRDQQLAAVPANFFVREHVPQGRVLRAAHLLVASGNSTAVLGALRAGVPSLLVPQGGEQPEVAARCAQAGVSLVLPESGFDAATVMTAIRRLLTEPAFAAAAARLRVAFTAFDSHDRAAWQLENLAAGGAPVACRERDAGA